MIKGIIFDLGGTLMHCTGDMAAVEREGAASLADWYLKKKHIKLDGPALAETFLAERQADRVRAASTGQEVTAQTSLRAALRKIEAPAAAAALVEAAVKVYFEPEEVLYQPFPEAAETLRRLHRQGYRLGLYSNATDDPLIQRLVNRGGLRPWLSPTFSSAACGWRKPRREAFELIARRWDLPPQQIAVVGDTLNTDILGAQNAGMAGILVTMTEAASNADHRHIQPAAVAESLAMLPDIIASLKV